MINKSFYIRKYKETKYFVLKVYARIKRAFACSKNYLLGLHRSSSIRILFILPNPRFGASGRYTQVIAKELQKRGCECMVLTEGEAWFESGVEWLPLAFKGPFLSPEIRHRISQFDPHIVYENGVRSKAQRAALEVVYLTGARLVMQSEDDDVQMHLQRHGEEVRSNLIQLDKTPVTTEEISVFLKTVDWDHSLNVLQNPLYDRWVEPVMRATCYHLASAHTAIWHPFAERLEKQYKKPVVVVPPVCEDSCFEGCLVEKSMRAGVLKSLSIPEDCTVFFVAGAVYNYSQEFFNFVKALNLAQAKSSKSLALVVSGKGNKQTTIDAVEGLSPHIHYVNLGNANDKTYTKILKAADIICSPGICDDFNLYRLPSRLVKAMAMGKPVLTANWGFGASLQNGVNAFITQGNNPDDWVPTIISATDFEKREAVGCRGKAFAEENFRAGPVCDKLFLLFRKLMLNQ